MSERRRAGETRFDEAARHIGGTVTRREALRSAARLALGLLVGGRLLRSSTGTAAAAGCPAGTVECRTMSPKGPVIAVGTCFDPATEQCCQRPLDGYPYRSAVICQKWQKCAAVFRFDGGATQNCESPICVWGPDGSRKKPYEPPTECCTPRGVQPRTGDWDVDACAGSRVPDPAFKGDIGADGCGGLGLLASPDFGEVGRPYCVRLERCFADCAKGDWERCLKEFYRGKKPIGKACDEVAAALRAIGRSNGRSPAQTERVVKEGVARCQAWVQSSFPKAYDLLDNPSLEAFERAQRRACKCCKEP